MATQLTSHGVFTRISIQHVVKRPKAIRPLLYRRRVSVRHKASSGEEVGIETDVQTALAEAEEALNTAQESVPKISTLPSAYTPNPIVEFMKLTAKRLLLLGSVFAVLYLLNFGTRWMRCFASVSIPAAIALLSLQNGSLSPSGAMASWFVGFGTFLAGFRSVAIVLSFFVSSSLLTKFKDEIKTNTVADHKKGGQRDWIQVCSNGLFATIFALTYAFATRFQDVPLGTRHGKTDPQWMSIPTTYVFSSGMSKFSTFMFGAVFGNYACACGDTWASELGVLSTTTPRLITTLRPVQRGTNGGVTLLGLAASLSGGLFVGISCYIATVLSMLGQPLMPVVASQWPIVVLGMIGGLVGSIVDSVLGATLQFSGYDRVLKKVVNRPVNEPNRVYRINGINILSNNQVNLLSGLTMALVIGYATMRLF